MTKTRALFAAACCSLGGLSAQNETLYYKFDDFGASTVVNFGTDPSAPREAHQTFGTLNATRYTTGRFGQGALDGTMFPGASMPGLDTGWSGAHQGDTTIAWYQRNNSVQPQTSASALLWRPDTAPTGTGLFLGTWDGDANHAPNESWWVLGWGGGALQFTPPAGPLHAVQGWHHVAIVFDHARAAVDFYWDGAVAQSRPLTGSYAVADNGQTVHLHEAHTWFAHCGDGFDLDEVRVVRRAATPVEIASWALQSTPAASALAPAGATSFHMSQKVPALGNLSYALDVVGAPAQTVVMFLGARTLAQPIAVGLPGMFRIEPLGVLFATTGATGTASIPMPLPEIPLLDGLTFYSQAALFDGATPRALTNALAHSLGRP